MWAVEKPEGNLAIRMLPIGEGKLIYRATLACLLLSLAAPAKAQGPAPVRTFGDWSVLWVQESVNLMAVTLDNYGNYIALRCLVQEQRCLHVLSVNSSCQADVSYPVLVSSGTNSRAMGFSCRDAESSTNLVADDQGEIHKIWKRDDVLGIFISTAGGYFRTARFSMKGAFEAMGYVKKYTREQDDV